MPDVLTTRRDEHFSTNHSPLDSRRFSNIEDMEENCQANGWSIEYRQIQAGKLTANTIVGKCAHILLLDKSVSRRIEAVGTSPEGYITVFAPVGRAKSWINGQSCASGGIFVFDSLAQFHIVTNENSRVLLMLIPSSQLQGARYDDLFNREGYDRIRTGLLEPGAALAQSLSLLMLTAIYQSIDECWQITQAARLTTTLTTIFAQHPGTSKKKYQTPREESVRTINHAVEFIDEHLCGPICVNQICAHSATSLSKLERAFRHELNMSPTEYILARRLVAVNRELRGASSRGRQISQIAMDCGFNHLGRFSGAYRTHFGELPSETLRLS